MTGPIKAPHDPENDNNTLTENNKHKGALDIETFDGLTKSIDEEVEAATEQVLDITFNAVGSVAFVADPFAPIINSGAGWLMEQIDPLEEVLDKITGNVDEVVRNSADAKALAASMRAVAEMHKQDVATLEGAGFSSLAHEVSTERLTIELEMMAEATKLRAKVVASAGKIIEDGREEIRGMIAEFIDELISSQFQSTNAIVTSPGSPAPEMMAEVVAEIAAFASKLAAKTAKIIDAHRRPAMLAPELDKALSELATARKRFENAADAAESHNTVEDVNENTPEARRGDAK